MDYKKFKRGDRVEHAYFGACEIIAWTSKEAIVNLEANKIQYDKPDGKTITKQKKDGFLFMTVKNRELFKTGEMLPDGMRPKIEKMNVRFL